jgi:hypothetical protein
MKCIWSFATCSIALMLFSVFSIRDASAVSMTLNLVQAESEITWGGFFGGQPFRKQEALSTSNVPPDPFNAPATPGITDYDATRPSNRTTYQGTITIDVDNPLAPTSIQILGSTANADPSGKWLPEDYAFLPTDIDGDNNHYEFPDDASSSVGTTPGVAAEADYGIRLRPSAGAPDVAYATLHDVEINVTTPAAVAANPAGVLTWGFDSATENFEFTTGWWDYWLHPTFTAEKLRQRLEQAGSDEDNLLAADSTYTLADLGGGLALVTLLIPVQVDFPDPSAPTSITGQLKATFVGSIPEPTSFVLLGTALLAALGIRRRK